MTKTMIEGRMARALDQLRESDDIEAVICLFKTRDKGAFIQLSGAKTECMKSLIIAFLGLCVKEGIPYDVIRDAVTESCTDEFLNILEECQII